MGPETTFPYTYENLKIRRINENSNATPKYEYDAFGNQKPQTRTAISGREVEQEDKDPNG